MVSKVAKNLTYIIEVIGSNPNVAFESLLIKVCALSKDENIGFDRYIDGCFYMNINISKMNKNTLKFIKILFKSVKMTLIIKYIH